MTALPNYRVATNAKTTFVNYLLTVFHEIIFEHDEAEEENNAYLPVFMKIFEIII